MNSKRECHCREEMCEAIQTTNQEIGEDDEEWLLFIMSMDVKAMYPSLDVRTITEEIEEEIRNTEVNFDNIDDQELGKHLSVTETIKDNRFKIIFK